MVRAEVVPRNRGRTIDPLCGRSGHDLFARGRCATCPRRAAETIRQVRLELHPARRAARFRRCDRGNPGKPATFDFPASPTSGRSRPAIVAQRTHLRIRARSAAPARARDALHRPSRSDFGSRGWLRLPRGYSRLRGWATSRAIPRQPARAASLLDTARVPIARRRDSNTPPLVPSAASSYYVSLAAARGAGVGSFGSQRCRGPRNDGRKTSITDFVRARDGRSRLLRRGERPFETPQPTGKINSKARLQTDGERVPVGDGLRQAGIGADVHGGPADCDATYSATMCCESGYPKLFTTDLVAVASEAPCIRESESRAARSRLYHLRAAPSSSAACLSRWCSATGSKSSARR
jgi:hypothetical protein